MVANNVNQHYSYMEVKMVKKMIKVIIDRRKWYRGDYGSALLVVPGNKMCCIGFLALKLGCTRSNIESVNILSEVPVSKALDFASKYKTSLKKAYNINDNTKIEDDIREKRLIVVGKRMGVDFIFKY
jgi:hypothetical protein